jgi:DNA-directed RNA polymerase specialized sigma24 family protein
MKVQNQQLFTSAIRDHSPSLLKIAAAFEHDEASQQELHQSIVLAIWQSLIHFENQCDLCIYVFRVAFN